MDAYWVHIPMVTGSIPVSATIKKAGLNWRTLHDVHNVEDLALSHLIWVDTLPTL